MHIRFSFNGIRTYLNLVERKICKFNSSIPSIWNEMKCDNRSSTHIQIVNIIQSYEIWAIPHMNKYEEKSVLIFWSFRTVGECPVQDRFTQSIINQGSKLNKLLIVSLFVPSTTEFRFWNGKFHLISDSGRRSHHFCIFTRKPLVIREMSAGFCKTVKAYWKCKKMQIYTFVNRLSRFQFRFHPSQAEKNNNAQSNFGFFWKRLPNWL